MILHPVYEESDIQIIPFQQYIKKMEEEKETHDRSSVLQRFQDMEELQNSILEKIAAEEASQTRKEDAAKRREEDASKKRTPETSKKDHKAASEKTKSNELQTKASAITYEKISKAVKKYIERKPEIEGLRFLQGINPQIALSEYILWWMTSDAYELIAEQSHRDIRLVKRDIKAVKLAIELDQLKRIQIEEIISNKEWWED